MYDIVDIFNSYFLCFLVVLPGSAAITFDKPLDDTVSYELPPFDSTTYEIIPADINVYEMPHHDAASSEADLQARDIKTYETLSSDAPEAEEPSNENESAVINLKPEPNMYMNVNYNAET